MELGLALSPESNRPLYDSPIVHAAAQNNQSERPGPALMLSQVNSLNSALSEHSVHSVKIIEQIRPRMGMDMAQLRGDQELGRRDYFARNLFVRQYGDDDDEEITCVRAHTQVKLLKIARDDFVLIMQAAQTAQGGSSHYLFNDNGVVGDGELPDRRTWKNQRAEIRLEELEEKAVLGIGSFGKVTLVRHRTT